MEKLLPFSKTAKALQNPRFRKRWGPDTVYTLFVPYEDLQKTPDEVRKDLEQVQEMLRFVLNRF
jgi:hypothetical protein